MKKTGTRKRNFVFITLAIALIILFFFSVCKNGTKKSIDEEPGQGDPEDRQIPITPPIGKAQSHNALKHAQPQDTIEAKESQRWQRWQTDFKKSMNIIKAFEKEKQISSEFKREAWKELLRVFNKDNPYTKEDDKLRKEIKQRIKFWGDKIEEKAIYRGILFIANKRSHIEVPFDDQKFKASIKLEDRDGLYFYPSGSYLHIELLNPENIKTQKTMLVIYFEQNSLKTPISADGVEYLLFVGEEFLLLNNRKMKFQRNTVKIPVKMNRGIKK